MSHLRSVRSQNEADLRETPLTEVDVARTQQNNGVFGNSVTWGWDQNGGLKGGTGFNGRSTVGGGG